jgi:hypothetical protein
VFDRWVEFMMNEIGIKGLISCYTMIPWELSFDYYDEATNRVQFIKTAPGDEAYAEYWGSFLRDFARHLKQYNQQRSFGLLSYFLHQQCKRLSYVMLAEFQM